MNGDITSRDQKDRWFYSDAVKDHFFHPRNFVDDLASVAGYTVGLVGSPACGDMMKVWIRVDPSTERITDLKWQTFGCASAIASTSMMSVIVTENGGRTLEEARRLKPQDVMDRLGGLPIRKVHCSVLGDKALRAAINEYYRKTEQHQKIEVEHGRIIDRDLNVTDHDIEEAVLEGAHTIDAIQQKTKVGTSNPSCLPEVEQLLRFYVEKHFGTKLSV